MSVGAIVGVAVGIGVEVGAGDSTAVGGTVVTTVGVAVALGVGRPGVGVGCWQASARAKTNRAVAPITFLISTFFVTLRVLRGLSPQQPRHPLLHQVVGHHHLVAVVGHGAGVGNAEGSGMGCVHICYGAAG